MLPDCKPPAMATARGDGNTGIVTILWRELGNLAGAKVFLPCKKKAVHRPLFPSSYTCDELVLDIRHVRWLGSVGLSFGPLLRLLVGTAFPVLLPQSHHRDLGKALFKLRRTQLGRHPLHNVFRHVAIATAIAFDTDFRRHIEEHRMRLVAEVMRQLHPTTALVRRQIGGVHVVPGDRKSTRLNSSHANISYAVFCLRKNRTDLPATFRPGSPDRIVGARRQ